MKKTIILMVAASLAIFASCKKEDLGPRPTDLAENSITAEAGPGSVLLKWSVPSDSNYRYIRVTYQNPDKSTMSVRNASVYSDSIRIDGLLARYGAIEFKLTPISYGGAEGATRTITAQAEAKPKVLKVTDDPAEKVLPASVADIHVSAPDAQEGKDLNALIDGNNGTFYHEDWHQAQPYPHYIVYKLPREVKAFHFFLKNRNNAGLLNPTKVDILMSEDFNGSYDPAANKAELVKELSGLPTTLAADYESPVMIASKPYRYFWFKIKEVNNNRAFAAIAELHVFAHKTSIYDPETGETTKE